MNIIVVATKIIINYVKENVKEKYEKYSKNRYINRRFKKNA